ncbi:hypothetical protein OpiT1DRAFT_03848 [Opitutaceae bacterium TAV1]|nr:hypothetical protein OpiT1DRAFT_03848 [Opitutaceae bacterium TAV1]
MADNLFPAAFVQQYSSNVEHLAARNKHIFAGKGLRLESCNAAVEYFDQVGSLRMHKITSRNADTVYDKQAHFRRRVACCPYGSAVIFDSADKVRGIIDPNSTTAVDQAAAINVCKDEVIVAAALGTAYRKEGDQLTDPDVAVELPADRFIPINYDGTASTTGPDTGLTLAKLIRLKSLISRDDVTQGLKKYFVHNQAMLDQLLLNAQEIKSTDYNAIKALVNGEVSTFLGMEWIKYEGLPIENGVRTCFAYCDRAILFATQKGAPVNSRIKELDAKWQSWEVKSLMDIGATRMREDWMSVAYCAE